MRTRLAAHDADDAKDFFTRVVLIVSKDENLTKAQVACLSGLRQSDVVVLIVGAGYGALQSSGMSATNEEYEEAKGRKFIFAFVQEGVERDPREAEFVDEVQKWESGLFRGGFRTAGELRQGVTRALHDYALANATGPVDQAEMAQRALALLP